MPGVAFPNDDAFCGVSRRRWIAKYAPDGPTWSEGCDTAMPSRERNRDELFNIYEVDMSVCRATRASIVVRGMWRFVTAKLFPTDYYVLLDNDC